VICIAIAIFVIVSIVLFAIGCIVIPGCRRDRRQVQTRLFEKRARKEYSFLSGGSLAGLYLLWHWWGFWAYHPLLSWPVFFYCVGVYCKGSRDPDYVSDWERHREGFILMHSLFASLGAVIVYLMGTEYPIPSFLGSVTEDVISILVSMLTILSFISIAVTLLLRQRLRGRHERAILICAYGFLAVSCYSLGYLSTLLAVEQITAMCFVLSALFGFFFGMIMSLVVSFNVYMFPFSIQLLLAVGLLVKNYSVVQDFLSPLLAWI